MGVKLDRIEVGDMVQLRRTDNVRVPKWLDGTWAHVVSVNPHHQNVKVQTGGDNKGFHRLLHVENIQKHLGLVDVF